MLVVSVLIFFLIRLIPGDIIDAMQAVSYEATIDRPILERILGLDAPAMVQYGRWIGVTPQMDGSFSGVFQGNLGMSWWQNSSVLG